MLKDVKRLNIYKLAKLKGKNLHEENIYADRPVPHSKSGLVPRSSFSGAGRLGFRGTGKGGTMGEGRGKQGQFVINLRRRRTVPVTAGGCQVSERGATGN
jgi:hypothetical protein